MACAGVQPGKPLIERHGSLLPVESLAHVKGAAHDA